MDDALPLIFLFLMGLAVLIYVVLDGYDLGVGILLSGADDAQKDRMVASIGPFWDANETWLVLGVGILLIAFPKAHGVILTSLYLPVALMLVGLILRGVAFDFRVKAHAKYKAAWNRAFLGGSLLATWAQGYMIGDYILGFEPGWIAFGFAAFIGCCLIAGYALLGAAWLILKTEEGLHAKAVRWAHRALWMTGAGVAAVSIATPLVSQRIFDKWFSLPELFWTAPVPIAAAALWLWTERTLARMQRGDAAAHWKPFAGAAGLFVLSFLGLAYSMFPYLVVDRLDIWQAASSPEALAVILIGVGITLPAILVYTVYSYKVFWGRAEDLHYD
ncbi:cytochrome d ubiquinol oxidase subunit II [Chiayiivirga flava]|uniref:Cytochrome d ubiquinol oxidase subunit II n=1 Tax=Chiayiivirga flava TaxID=659595 RepID=A0A7W8D5L1_9GAMM|nr:cytochrome d ubiquinol oxidase subunit II [Chiayiivirga flava]MBB5207957.1 cytochrome d ubiquinol oxidase subunit II [Chiayiivirga flava]